MGNLGISQYQMCCILVFNQMKQFVHSEIYEYEECIIMTKTSEGVAHVSIQSQTDHHVREVVLAAMFAALTLLATSILKIQTPTFGYIHIGDAFVLMSGIFLGPLYGGLAAGIGSGLSDLMGGYAMWVPGTFAIKFLTAFVAAHICCALMKKDSKKRPATAAVITSGVIGEAVMVAGYFLYNILMVAMSTAGFTRAGLVSAATASLAEIPFNLVQGAVGIVLAVLLIPVLWKAVRSFTREM